VACGRLLPLWTPHATYATSPCFRHQVTVELHAIRQFLAAAVGAEARLDRRHDALHVRAPGGGGCKSEKKKKNKRLNQEHDSEDACHACACSWRAAVKAEKQRRKKKIKKVNQEHDSELVLARGGGGWKTEEKKEEGKAKLRA
jgi:N-methylhydantoinase B/oxoprolinase/acetone carboxylase alpha subunit